ncbi:MAG: hypothetical protein GY861_21980 [bacterium]|nr:hypothetical protein [bacterium]
MAKSLNKKLTDAGKGKSERREDRKIHKEARKTARTTGKSVKQTFNELKKSRYKKEAEEAHGRKFVAPGAFTTSRGGKLPRIPGPTPQKIRRVERAQARDEALAKLSFKERLAKITEKESRGLNVSKEKNRLLKRIEKSKVEKKEKKSKSKDKEDKE